MICPYCAENIQDGASVCSICREELAPSTPDTAPTTPLPARPSVQAISATIRPARILPAKTASLSRRSGFVAATVLGLAVLSAIGYRSRASDKPVGGGYFTGNVNGLSVVLKRMERDDTFEVTMSLDLGNFGNHIVTCTGSFPVSRSSFSGTTTCSGLTRAKSGQISKSVDSEDFALEWDAAKNGWWITLQSTRPPARTFLSFQRASLDHLATAREAPQESTPLAPTADSDTSASLNGTHIADAVPGSGNFMGYGEPEAVLDRASKDSLFQLSLFSSSWDVGSGTWHCRGFFPPDAVQYAGTVQCEGDFNNGLDANESHHKQQKDVALEWDRVKNGWWLTIRGTPPLVRKLMLPYDPD
jgi:hypothetical protein